MIVFSILFITIAAVNAQFVTHFYPNHSTIVHLFEWKWNDIAKECEEFLGPNGYGGVQLSPVNENAIVDGRPWFERYQPLSYNLTTRSGNEQELKDMIARCNKAGVRIYVDVVFNHMAPSGQTDVIKGTAGSEAKPGDREYPNFSAADFHQSCLINNYQDAKEIRNCELSGLPDLNQSRPNVQREIIDFLNKLIGFGVAGFRVDACKHMKVTDLTTIYRSLNNLRTDFGFPKGARPFIFQEVIDVGGEGVKKIEYIKIGTVTEFIFSSEIGLVFQGQHGIEQLKGIGPARTFLPKNRALVFVDNHDNQRGHGGGGIVLTHKKPKEYTSAVAFMLANTYGIPRVMSSYTFNDPSQGPPADTHNNIISPETESKSGLCLHGWVCEHRWPAIKNMVKFRIAAGDAGVENWKTYNGNALSFCRGPVGCAVFVTGNNNLVQQVQTTLAPGRYCDIISGEVRDGGCTGKELVVGNDGKVSVDIKADDQFSTVAIYSGSKIE